MNRISKLEKVFEHFINENIEEAQSMLRSVILDIAAETNQKLAEAEEDIEDLERDMGEDLASDVSDDLAEIEAEEMYDDLDLDDSNDMSVDDAEEDLIVDLSNDTDLEDEIEVDLDDSDDHVDDEPNFDDLDIDMNDLEDEVEDLTDRLEDVEDTVEDYQSKFDELCKEFEKLQQEDEDLEYDDAIAESFELDEFDIDMKDETDDSNSPVPVHNDLVELEGEAVKTPKKDSAVSSSDAKVDSIDGGNTVKTTDSALDKVNEGAKRIKNSIVKKSKR